MVIQALSYLAEVYQEISETSRRYLEYFHRFPKVPEQVRRPPKISEEHLKSGYHPEYFQYSFPLKRTVLIYWKELILISV